MILRKFKSFYKKIRIFNIYIFKSPNPFKVNFFKRLLFNCLGFNNEQIILYDLSIDNYKNYITEYERRLSRETNKNYKFLVDDSLAFFDLFKNDLQLSEHLFYVKNNKLINKNGKFLNKNEVKELLSDHKTYLKPNLSGGGIGIYTIELIGNEWKLNGETKPFDYIYKRILKSNNFIAKPELIQEGFSNKIYPHTVNTIRLVTGYNFETGKVEVLDALHRFGTSKSFPVDNTSSGGVFSLINLENGELSEAKNYNKETFDRHPDTSVMIKGKIIPNWKELLTYFKEKASAFYYIPYMAWDIVVSGNEFKVVEINASTGITLFQMWGGKKNDKLGKYLKHMNIVK